MTQQLGAQQTARPPKGSTGSGDGGESKEGTGGFTPAYEGSSRATAKDSSSSTSSSSSSSGPSHDDSKQQEHPGATASRAGSSSQGTSSSSAGSSSSTNVGQADAAGSSPMFVVPDMRRSIAWMLCYRRLKHALIQDALRWLKETHSADDIKDLQVGFGSRRFVLEDRWFCVEISSSTVASLFFELGAEFILSSTTIIILY